VRELLDLHELSYSNGSELGDTPDVVPAEVYQHHVLGSLFRVGEQIRSQQVVTVTRDTAAARSGDGTKRHSRGRYADEQLGRAADDLEPVQQQVVHVR
jgi:hypothetical protein